MNRTIIIATLGAIALLGGLAAAVFWFGAPGQGGERRPDFAVTDIHGDVRQMSEWDGKLVLLNFWATWCAPCRKEIPLLIQAQNEYGDQGLQIVGLAVDEPQPVRQFAEKYGINYPLLVDAMKVVKIQDALQGGAGLPVSILIDRQGRVRERVVGEMDQARLEQLLAPYLEK